MTPESPEGRLGRLEREMSALQQQVSDVIRDVDQLVPLREAVARIEENIKTIQRSVGELRDVVAADRVAAKERGEALNLELVEMRKDATLQARANRTQLISGVVAIVTTLLIVGGTIIAAGIG